MIVQLTLIIWRPENIICNMASGSLIGQSIFDLVSATWWTVKVDGRSSFRASVLAVEHWSLQFLYFNYSSPLHAQGRKQPLEIDSTSLVKLIKCYQQKHERLCRYLLVLAVDHFWWLAIVMVYFIRRYQVQVREGTKVWRGRILWYATDESYCWPRRSYS